MMSMLSNIFNPVQLRDDTSVLHLRPGPPPADNIPSGDGSSALQLQRMQPVLLYADTAYRDDGDQSEEDLPDICKQTLLCHVVRQQPPPPSLLGIHL